MTLHQGIEKFQFQAFPERKEKFRLLEGGPSPETPFITCSDSRIDPNLITQTAPGELFVIRNAGNIVPRPGVGDLQLFGWVDHFESGEVDFSNETSLSGFDIA